MPRAVAAAGLLPPASRRARKRFLLRWVNGLLKVAQVWPLGPYSPRSPRKLGKFGSKQTRGDLPPANQENLLQRVGEFTDISRPIVFLHHILGRRRREKQFLVRILFQKVLNQKWNILAPVARTLAERWPRCTGTRGISGWAARPKACR